MNDATPPSAPQPRPTQVVPLSRRGSLVAQSAAAREISLRPTTLEEFLPSVQPWIRLGGWLVVAGFSVGSVFLAMWPYRVVVRGPGLARPSGETGVVSAPRSGRVRAILVRPDQPVERGQVMAILDPTDLQGRQLQLGQNSAALRSQQSARNQEAMAAVEAAELEVEKARAALAFAQSEYDRYLLLLRSGAGSAQQMEEKKANLGVARADLAKAGRMVAELRSRSTSELARLSQELNENRAEQAQLGRDLGRTSVRSPVQGVVLSLALRNPMQEVAAGQELARIAPRTGGLLVKMQVASEDIAEVAPGQRADLRVAACPYPDFGTLPGRVVSVAADTLPSAVEQTPGPGGLTDVPEMKRYIVTIRPDRPDLRTATRRCALRPGMDLRADITTRQETLLSFVLRKARLLVSQ